MSERTPDALIALVAGLDVRNNPAFLPGVLALPVSPGDKTDCVWLGQAYRLVHYTRCNGYAQALSVALGVPLPAYMTADQQLAWLQSSTAKARGWRQCDQLEAIGHANAGRPLAIAASDVPHGHIGFGVPNPLDRARLYCTAAGAVCTSKMLMSDQFAHLAPRALCFWND